MTADFTVSDLRQCPDFFDTVADRIWQAWWEPKGVPLAYIAGRLTENLNADPLPIALVAHDGPTFLGTSSVIASDLEDLPQYTPWVAAVWVDPEHRKRQIGRTLVARAAQDVFALGIDRVYLCAPKLRRNFYLRQGWVPIEEDVGDRSVTVFVLEQGCGASGAAQNPPKLP
ncbi:GNAT family N-acetyltransferase [Tardiphaga sp.]|uniref:GNAT family N-acetyltransferase n=1 Tax=Tardiphaga sp. TaxID=1926292 RepID=UPI002621FB88|nr:GNAT family N-acetyltransferase [Tardiphaga sp.]MDB5616709.1 N-acetyltransferase [Tardiphaga sp.]